MPRDLNMRWCVNLWLGPDMCRLFLVPRRLQPNDAGTGLLSGVIHLSGCPHLRGKTHLSGDIYLPRHNDLPQHRDLSGSGNVCGLCNM